MEGCIGRIGYIEAKVCFAMSGIGAVAFETFVGKDGTDMEIVAYLIREASGRFRCRRGG